MKNRLGVLALVVLMPFFLMKARPFHWTSQYDVVWTHPSQNSSESMPLGGGDLGCNVWVESGDLLLYLQRSGCFSENGEYLKLGRVRLRLSPNPFDASAKFSQQLRLADGSIRITATGADGLSATVDLWVDIFTHSVHMDVKANRPVGLGAFYENWRLDDRELTDERRGRFGCFGLEGYPGRVVKRRDYTSFCSGGVLFYHYNPERILSTEVMLEQQGLTDRRDEITDLMSHLAFGGYLSGEGMQPAGSTDGSYAGTPFRAWRLQSKEKKRRFHVQVATQKQQTEDISRWRSNMLEIAKATAREQGNPAKNRRWWRDFWDRSWIQIGQTDNRNSPEWEMGRNYQLFRYQLGGNMYGDYPTKFNGGNLTFDPVFVDAGMQHDPDWRQWGGDVFTAQNQRLLFWPMLKSGDFEGMLPQFELYRKGLPGARMKVARAFGHRGAAFCEYANDAGLDFGAGWGWDSGSARRRGREVPFGSPEANATSNYGGVVEKGMMANGSIAYHWESQVEHVYMILEYHRFTGRNIDAYLPFIKESLIFFDEHYRKRQLMRNGKPYDENGKLVFYPSTSCESYRGAKNPTDLIAGIRSCIESLLTLESDSLSASERTYFADYLRHLPEPSFGVVQGDSVMLPAESYIRYQNVECPQFYPLFPFNRYDFQSPFIPIFRNTWKHGNFPKNMVISWHQDGIFYARMGMVREAYEYNLKKLGNSPRRFPTFWGPGHDWVPDHNWGGSGMIGLQEMLLQTVGQKIYILPCWPADKDVRFKLHAPDKTVVEVEFAAGKVRKLSVTPRSRRKDIVLCL